MLIQLPILFALYDVIRNPLTYILRYEKGVVEKIAKLVGGNVNDQISLIDKIVAKGGLDVKGADFEAISGLKDSFSFFGFDLTVIPKDNLWGIYIAIPILTFVFSFFSSKLIRKFSYQPQVHDGLDDAFDVCMDLRYSSFCNRYLLDVPEYSFCSSAASSL